MFNCIICKKEFQSVYALSAHKRSHTNYEQPIPVKCSSILSRKIIPVNLLDKHNKTFLNKIKKCIQCGSETPNPRFCSRSCAGTYNNLHAPPTRKRGPAPKVRPPKAKHPKTFKVKVPKISEDKAPKLAAKKGRPKKILIIEETYPYTFIYKNICAKTHIIFYSKSFRKYHPNLKDTRENYARSCKFNFQINKFPLWFNGDLIKEFGMYSTPGSRNGIKNLNGVSRDHMVSISFGWDNDIDPTIIRHPANCQLVNHQANQKKYNQCSISLDELYEKIEQFEILYPDWKII